MRFILIFIALAVLVVVVKRLWPSSSTTRKSQIPSSKMVQCARCGMYTPETEAINHNGTYYCSKTHRDEDNQA